MAVSKDEYIAWLLDPVTKAVRKILQGKAEMIKDKWAEGQWADDPKDDAYARGLIGGFLAMEQLDEDFG